MATRDAGRSEYGLPVLITVTQELPLHNWTKSKTVLNTTQREPCGICGDITDQKVVGRKSRPGKSRQYLVFECLICADTKIVRTVLGKK